MYSIETIPLELVDGPQVTLIVVRDVGEQADVHVLEQPGPHQVCLAGKLFLGDAGPELEGALELLALHDPL